MQPDPEFDEMVTGGGELRPAWSPLIGTLHALPEGVFAARAARVSRQYAETGRAYPGTGPQPVPPLLCPIPMLLPAAEWEMLARGLDQRARLLDAIAADLYGPRSLLSEGLVPARLVYANPRFLRPCCDIAPAGGALVHAYAADLVRLPDGAWHVAADRLQAPGGIGAALQNRGVLVRTVPELFRAAPVQRLEPFFEMWQARLAALAPSREHGGQARIALLTPGQFAPSFLEHVFLARQLGATLVEGADLTVRDGHVHLKTLSSLQRIDVLLRFMDDDFTDPLELRSDSMLGVPGLMQAIRGGRVAMVNAPGASVVEAPELRPLLPALAERLLGEALRLPSAPVPSDGHAPARGSVAPAWFEGALVPRPVTLRMFLVHDGSRYVAMPGGFAESSLPSGRRLVKDIWVAAGADWPGMAARPGAAPAVLSAGPGRVRITPVPDDLRSRTADDLFWLGRYAERLDNAARVLRAATLRLTSGSIGPGEAAEVGHMLRLLGELGLIEPVLAEMLPDGRALLAAMPLAWGSDSPLGDLFAAVGRIAETLRDRLSKDMEVVVLGPLQQARAALALPQDADRMIVAIEALIGLVAAFGGMVGENMTQSSGWLFLDIGRRIERALYGAALLSELLDGTEREGEAPLELALELSDSTITYHSRYLGVVQTGPVVDLLLSDPRNPRSVAFQLARIEAHLRELARGFSRAEAPGAEAATSLLDALRATRLEGLEQPPGRAALLHSLAGTSQRLYSLSDRLTRAYLSHTRMPTAVGYRQARA
ncbi:MAG: circularly permuted type 2 ATP-grasp protein [Janthinobacterium lividum]